MNYKDDFIKKDSEIDTILNLSKGYLVREYDRIKIKMDYGLKIEGEQLNFVNKFGISLFKEYVKNHNKLCNEALKK